MIEKAGFWAFSSFLGNDQLKKVKQKNKPEQYLNGSISNDFEDDPNCPWW